MLLASSGDDHIVGVYLQEDDTMMNIAAALEKEGITAFRFDFSGNG